MNSQNSHKQALVEQYTRAMASKMEAYVQEHYAPNFKLAVTVSFAPSRRRCWGGIKKGVPYISIVGKRYAVAVETGNLIDQLEYASIANDPVIGSLKNVPWRTAIAAIVAHEVSHAVQYFPSTKQQAMKAFNIAGIDSRSEILKHHDWFWQRIYADLRTVFVNGANEVVIEPVEPVEPVAPQQARPKRTISKGWSVKSQQVGKSRFSFYYTASEELIGVLCVAPGGYFRYYPETETFVKLQVKNFNEARKIEFGI